MQRYDHGGDIYRNQGVQLDVSANINPLGMPPAVREAVMNQMDTFTRYPDYACDELREAIASHHGISTDQVLCGNGAADLIFRICACLKSKLALVTAPTFSEYERAVLVHGGQVKYHLLLEDALFDVDDTILDDITREVALVFLCTPNNPTGRLIDTDLLARIAKTCQAQNTVLVVDECFIDFTDGVSIIPLLSACPNLLILRAFTKMYAMAGLRLGYLLASDPALLRRVAAFGATWSVSGPAQAAGLAALSCENWVDTTRTLIKQEREMLQDALTQLGFYVIPGAANYLLIKSEQPLYQPMLTRGILVRDCGNYTGLSSQYIRIGIQTPKINKRLIAALTNMLRDTAHLHQE